MDFVIDEASRGDPDAAKRRLNALENVGLLLPDPEIEAIADKIVVGCMMPPKAKLEALHVASAVLAGVEYLLTQNCRHIANATELSRLYRLFVEGDRPRVGVAAVLFVTGSWGLVFQWDGCFASLESGIPSD